MQKIVRQTYLYIALEESLKQLHIEYKQSSIKFILENVIKSKIISVKDKVTSKSKSNSKLISNHITAYSIFDSEFPEGEQQIQKFQTILYDAQGILPKQASNWPGSQIALMELYPCDLYEINNCRSKKGKNVKKQGKIKNQIKQSFKLKQKSQ